MKILIPEHKIERRFCLAIALLVCFGIVSAIAFNDWTHFEKSGSLIVVTGVLLAWRDLTGTLDWAQEYAIDEIDKQILSLKSESGLLRRAMNMSNVEELDILSNKLRLQIAAAKIRVRTYELLAVVTGTIISSYGSWLGDLIFLVTN
jgi:hypothetical protein